MLAVRRRGLRRGWGLRGRRWFSCLRGRRIVYATRLPASPRNKLKENSLELLLFHY